MNSSRITLESRYYDQLLSIISRTMAGSHGTIILFGSRARGNPRPTSDIDMAVSVKGSSGAFISRLRENFENSTIPFTVDIVDLGSCDPVLETEVEREGVMVWSG